MRDRIKKLVGIISSRRNKLPIKKNIISANWVRSNLVKPAPKTEKEINQYITLKMEYGKTQIYVNGEKFIQCIHLILNIPINDVPLYDEIDSIDEAAKMYSKNIHQNRIIMGPMAFLESNLSHNITPEQEFWGHCSNIQAWVEHEYDTRILMSNISFPLLRELTRVGDPKAKSVYKEEIALRLESGYPSVVQYLLTQGYIQVFSPSEFETIIESTELIKNLSSEPRILSQFLISCIAKFPSVLEAILLHILKLPEGKELFFSLIRVKPGGISPFRPYLRYNNPYFLGTLKTALDRLFLRVGIKTGEDILDCIHAINIILEEQPPNLTHASGRNLLSPRSAIMGELKELFKKRDGSGRNQMEIISNRIMNDIPLDEVNEEHELLPIREKLLQQFRWRQSKCSYCEKIIPKNKDTCDWCGHKKDDEEGGFYPYPFIFKPPGGGDGSPRRVPIAVPVQIKS